MEMLLAVTKRLAALGYTVTEADRPELEYQIAKAETKLKISTNRLEVPQELRYIWIDMAAGMLLAEKKASGQLLDCYDFSPAATSISEGDTSVSFAGVDSAGAQFDAMLERLTTPDEDMILAFRRLVW